MQLNFSFKVSRERFITYCHYLILLASIVMVGFIAYANFNGSGSSSEAKYVLLKNDTTQVLNDENVSHLDSIPQDLSQPQVTPIPAGSLTVSTDSSVFIDEQGTASINDTISAESFHVIEERMQLPSSKVKAINDEAQTWFRLIIDFF